MNAQEKISRGTRAENLMKNENWKVMIDYIANRTNYILDMIAEGTKPENEEYAIMKTSDQVYRECVGELRALKRIEIDFKRYVDQKNKLIEKYENGQH